MAKDTKSNIVNLICQNMYQKLSEPFLPKQSRHIHGTLCSRFLPPLHCCFEPVCHLACPARALSQCGFGQYRFCGRVTTLSLSRNQNIFCWQPSLLGSSRDSTYKRWDTKHWLKNVQIVKIVPGILNLDKS